LFCFGFWALQATALAKDKPANSYPEKGHVVAVHVSETTDYRAFSPLTQRVEPTEDKHRKQVYRVETDDGIYELEDGKNPTMAVGDALKFRVEKEIARVSRREGKEMPIESDAFETCFVNLFRMR
jgi:hypothetical protein